MAVLYHRCAPGTLIYDVMTVDGACMFLFSKGHGKSPSIMWGLLDGPIDELAPCSGDERG